MVGKDLEKLLRLEAELARINAARSQLDKMEKEIKAQIKELVGEEYEDDNIIVSKVYRNMLDKKKLYEEVDTSILARCEKQIETVRIDVKNKPKVRSIMINVERV